MKTSVINKGGAVSLDMTVLDNLREKLVESRGARAEVGLFSNNAARTGRNSDVIDNPNLGKEHEFGNPETDLPERSFLRFPLMTRLFPAVKDVDWVEKIQKGGLPRALKTLGVIGEEVVQEAFATRGFGFWQPLRPKTIARKGGSDKILIESQQLRRAVASRVVKP